MIRRFNHGPIRALILVALATVSCGTDDPFGRGGRAMPVRTPQTDGLAPVDRAYFQSNVAPKIEESCTGCHANPAATYEAAVLLVKAGASQDSRLYLRVTGSNHMAIWEAGSAEAESLRLWIDGSR